MFCLENLHKTSINQFKACIRNTTRHNDCNETELLAHYNKQIILLYMCKWKYSNMHMYKYSFNMVWYARNILSSDLATAPSFMKFFLTHSRKFDHIMTHLQCNSTVAVIGQLNCFRWCTDMSLSGYKRVVIILLED